MTAQAAGFAPQSVGLPERWVAIYTRGLPDDVRGARHDEIASDVYEQQAAQSASSERGVRLSIVGRTLRGVPGDVAWRTEERRAMKQSRYAETGRPHGMRAAWATATQAWFTPFAVLVGVCDIAIAIWVLTDDEGKMPGQVIGPILLLAMATAMFAGLWLRWKAQYGTPSEPSPPRARPSLSIAGQVLLTIFGLWAVVFGVTVAWPSLVMGILILVGVAIAATRRRSSPAEPVPHVAAAGSDRAMLADVLIVVGTLPSLMMFWWVFPAVLALVVIGGVIGTGPGARRAAAA